MYRTAIRSASRPAINALRSGSSRAAPRRFASTVASSSSRSWKSSALRWGLAVAGVYYYNTSSVFADEFTAPLTATLPHVENEMHTVDSLVEKRRQEAGSTKPTAAATPSKDPKTPESADGVSAQNTVAIEGSPAALEEEAGQEGAFNPETGEINWDCPCLGGMAHGPCGEEFKTAFSCFVYSEQEPKGMDCIEKFQGMQECFREYPEIYGSELADTESDEPAGDDGNTTDTQEASTVAKEETKDAAAEPAAKSAEPEHQELRKETAAAPSARPSHDEEPVRQLLREEQIKPAESTKIPDATDATDSKTSAPWADASAANEKK